MISLTEEDLQELQEIVLKQKMIELFEDPSTYEDDDYDDGLVIIHWVCFTYALYVVAFMCGVIIGYIVGFRNGGM